MAKSPKTKFPLADVVRQWRDGQGWEDEISLDEEEMRSRLNANVELEGDISVRVFIETDEKRQWLQIYIYGPMKIPKKRYSESCELVNGINRAYLGLGALIVRDEQFLFFQCVDVEGAHLVPTMIENTLTMGYGVFSNWNESMGQVVFAGISAEEVFRKLDEKSQQVAQDSSDDVPEKL